MEQLNVFKNGTYANSVDPDETPQDAASHQCLRCLTSKHSFCKGRLFVYDQALLGDNSSKGVYKEVIST